MTERDWHEEKAMAIKLDYENANAVSLKDAFPDLVPSIASALREAEQRGIGRCVEKANEHLVRITVRGTASRGGMFRMHQSGAHDAAKGIVISLRALAGERSGG